MYMYQPFETVLSLIFISQYITGTYTIVFEDWPYIYLNIL